MRKILVDICQWPNQRKKTNQTKTRLLQLTMHEPAETWPVKPACMQKLILQPYPAWCMYTKEVKHKISSQTRCAWKWYVGLEEGSFGENGNFDNYGQRSVLFEIITELVKGNCVNREEQGEKCSAVVSGSRPRFLADITMLPCCPHQILATQLSIPSLPANPPSLHTII